MRYSDVLDRLQRQEESWVGLPVVAPRQAGGGARVTVDGLVWECRVDSPFEGWGVFRIGRDRTARLVREADAWERDEWAQCRAVQSAVLLESGKTAHAWCAALGRTIVSGLADGLERFETVRAAWDGAGHWVLGIDPRVHPGRAASLRARFAGDAGSSGDIRLRVEAALALADARLVSCLEDPGGGARVTWTKRDKTFTSQVNGALQVESAGFCLSGTDRQHDLVTLASLIGHEI